jgi:hypothetical protein
VAQDYYDILQVFDHIVDILDDNRATLGIKYIAENDEALIPEYPAILVQTDRTQREHHATGQFMVRHHLDIWIFHAQLSVSAATRSRRDIELATAVRKLLHANRTLDGHIIFGFVDGEFPGVSGRVVGTERIGIMTTRLTWAGELRAPFEVS